ncbi:DNA repair protein RadC [candidate division WOR-3 bacterium]|nr:DNA repair protein RadC [candidate division WOR-3 bacterium]
MEKDDKLGHRERLRERFLRSGLKGFHDYEIVELLLTMWTPRRDCKKQAKEAITRFKNLKGILEAEAQDLQKIKGIGPVNAAGIKFVQELAKEFLKQKLEEKPVCKSSQEVYDYLYLSMRDLKKEAFKVLFLNGQNRVIEAEDLFQGTVGASAVYPREIMEKAIEYHASSLILVHNHPSGSVAPSRSDRSITQDLVFAGNIMQIKVLDHIIIGDNKYYSFADEGLIEEYNQLQKKGG